MAAGASTGEAPMEAPAVPVFKQPQPINPNSLPFFSRISEDILVNVFSRLEQDPRDLARLACVCRRFTNVIKISCWRHQCMRVVPTIVSELMHSTTHHDLLGEPPCGWGSLQKLLVCCPGLRHAGVLLECWDFGLEREIGNSDDYKIVKRPELPPDGVDGNAGVVSDSSKLNEKDKATGAVAVDVAGNVAGIKRKKMKEPNDDAGMDGPVKQMKEGGLHYHNKMMKDQKIVGSYRRLQPGEDRSLSGALVALDRHQQPPQSADEVGGRAPGDAVPGCNHKHPHLAQGSWSLTREQGNKLLASRFRDDSLYICDWPGCMHPGEKRIYKLFRGIFKNFKQSHVWRNLKDQGSRNTELPCAFCSSRKTYDMVTSFCLRRSFEYHDDGEPVVRAYVCENGHVAGAWTDRPLYNL